MDGIFNDGVHEFLIRGMTIEQAPPNLGRRSRVDERNDKYIAATLKCVLDGRIERGKAVFQGVHCHKTILSMFSLRQVQHRRCSCHSVRKAMLERLLASDLLAW